MTPLEDAVWTSIWGDESNLAAVQVPYTGTEPMMTIRQQIRRTLGRMK